MLWLGLPILCWINVRTVGILVLFLILEKKLQPLAIEYDVIYGFVKYGLYYVEVCSLYTHFVESFYHKWLLSFFLCFFCICWDNQFLSLVLLMWCLMLIALWMLHYPCIPGTNFTWSWYMIPLMCCWFLFANILLSIFASMFIKDIEL